MRPQFSPATRDRWGRPQSSYGNVRSRRIEIPGQAAGPGWGPCAWSEDRRHRYTLARCFDAPAWQAAERRLLFVMLNPSTADEETNDPTIRRCCGFAQSWGYSHLAIANLFSLRSTDPKALYSDDEAEGDPENLTWILQLALQADLVICAWGVHGALRGRGKRVREMLEQEQIETHILGLTKGGCPRHPLYLSGGLRPVPWDANAHALSPSKRLP